MTDCKIIIPIYKNDLNDNELHSLRRCYDYLSEYPIVFAKPESLDVSSLLTDFPNIEIENFQDDYFKSTWDYNRLMLSEAYYCRFLDSKFILIHQLDAYVFRKNLDEWIQKDYDYIGAPWLQKPKYKKMYYRIFLRIRSVFYKIQQKPFRREILADKVGNGGLSLRRVLAHYNETIEKKEGMQFFIEQSKCISVYNEDVFWATQIPHFKYPTVQEAIKFSIDQFPEISYELNNRELPFGCHGWVKSDKIGFWEKFVFA